MKELRKIEEGLVPVYETSTGQKVVYGSELYGCIGSKRQYADWIRGRISECDAVENEDYETFSQNCEKPSGGRPKTEYIIQLDMAKEMAMLERNDKGKQVRRYFIQVEKKYKNSRCDGLPSGKQLMAMAVLEAQKTIAKQNQVIERMRPKELFSDAVAASHSSILIGELAKIIRQNGIDTGEKRLFQWMRQEGYLIRRNGTDYNMPTQRSMEMKLFEIRERTVTNPDGSIRITKTVLVTGKGQQYFINRFLQNQEGS